MAEVIDSAIDDALDNVFTALPGRVEFYDKATQKVDVQPLVKEYYINELDERVAVEIPVIPNVPVQFPRAGKFGITFPVEPGDLVLLVFSMLPLGRLSASDGSNVVEPFSQERHGPSSAIAIPGYFTFGKVPTEAPDDAVVVHSNGKEILLGSTGADQTVAIKRDCDRIKDALKNTTIAAAIYAVGSGADPTGTALATAVNSYFNANPITGAPKVKADD